MMFIGCKILIKKGNFFSQQEWSGSGTGCLETAITVLGGTQNLSGQGPKQPNLSLK